MAKLEVAEVVPHERGGLKSRSKTPVVVIHYQACFVYPSKKIRIT